MARIYNVPGWMRVLAGAGASGAALSVPSLLQSGSWVNAALVSGLGAFAASIAVFGRRAETVVERT